MKDIILIEAASKNTYQRKYKCPYCEQKYEKSKLHIHIQNKHEDLIPEGYTALRVAFNTINNKTEGHCIMCGRVSDWNEDKGRYERLCNDPKCHEAYKRMAAERNKKKYGTERLQSDPRYAEEVQRKALQGRRIAGKYKFADGGEIEYLGAYERRFLEFMDKIMNCKSEDIAAPGPTIKYNWNNAEHLYISDFYYIPYNLIVEIKDGGDNPNNNPAMRGYKTDRQQAKEAAVKATGKYNYIRQTNNDFSQIMSIMAILKYNLQNECYDPIMKINEQSLLESILFNEKDIYYNKEKFDSGEINLCFITGHSGSGKSTMAKDMSKDGVEHYELDDLQCIKDHFTMDQLKEYGDLIYSYFKGPGKKFYVTYKELVDNNVPGEEYEDKLFPEFVHYAMKYANSHKNKKFVIEGVWLFCKGENDKYWFDPEEFKDYAFYIKGTSMIISKWRGSLRDAKSDNTKQSDVLRYTAKNFFLKNWKWYLIDEKRINRFRNYFKKISVNESVSLYNNEYDINYSQLLKYNMIIIGEIHNNHMINIYRKLLSTYKFDYLIAEFADIDRSFTREELKQKMDNCTHGSYKYDPSRPCDDQYNYWLYKLAYEFNIPLIGCNPVNKKYKNMNDEDKIREAYMLSVIKEFESKGKCLVQLGDHHLRSIPITKDFLEYCNDTIDNRGIYKNINDLIVDHSSPIWEEYSDKSNVLILRVKNEYNNEINFMKNIKNNKINEVTEDMSGTIGAALAPTAKGSNIIKPLPVPTPYESDPDHYMIVHPKDNLKLSYSITRDPLQYSIFSVDPQEKGFYKVFKTDKGKIKKPYLTFKIKDKQKAKELYESLNELYNRNLTFTENGLRSDEKPDFIYSYLTDGSIIRTNDQILFDNRFEIANNFDSSIQEISNDIYDYLKGERKFSQINILEQQLNELEGIINE